MKANPKTADSPAYPPQILLDQFNQPVAPAPGFSKLEAVALELLPYFLKLAEDKNLTARGNKLTPIECAFYIAEDFCAHYDKLRQEAQNKLAIE